MSLHPVHHKSIVGHTTFRGVSHNVMQPLTVTPLRPVEAFMIQQSGRDQDLVNGLGYTLEVPVVAATADLLPLYQYYEQVPFGRCVGPHPLRVASINTGTDVLTMEAAHGLSNEDAVTVGWDETAPTLSAGSLSRSTTYYFRSASSTTGTLHTTAEDAAAGTNAVNFSAFTPTTAGDFYLYREFPLLFDRQTGRRITFRNTLVTKLPDLVGAGGKRMYDGSLIFRVLPGVGTTPDGSDDTDAFYSSAGQAYTKPTFAGTEALTKVMTAAWGGAAPWDSFKSLAGFRATFELQFEETDDGEWGAGSAMLFTGCKVTVKATPIGLTIPEYEAGMAAPLGKLLDGEDLVLTGTGLALTLKQAILEPQATRYAAKEGIVQELTWHANGDGATALRAPFSIATS